jgi:hypothetical protein
MTDHKLHQAKLYTIIELQIPQLPPRTYLALSRTKVVSLPTPALRRIPTRIIMKMTDTCTKVQLEPLILLVVCQKDLRKLQ